MIWTDGSVPFPFGKGGSGVLANCSRCGTEATLSYSAGPVCSSFPSLRHSASSLLWSWQHQQVFHITSFSFSDSRSFLATLFPPLSFLLPQTFRCNGHRHSLLLSSCRTKIDRIEKALLQRLPSSEPGYLSFHFVLSNYGRFAPLALWPLFVSLRPLVHG